MIWIWNLSTGFGLITMSYNSKLRVIVNIDEGLVPESQLPASKLIEYMNQEFQVLRLAALAKYCWDQEWKFIPLATFLQESELLRYVIYKVLNLLQEYYFSCYIELDCFLVNVLQVKSFQGYTHVPQH